MTIKFVIAWRAPGKAPIFYRGNQKRKIFLPYVSSEEITRGWVQKIEEARIFDGPPCLGVENISKHLNTDYVKVFPYEDVVLKTQIFVPLVRKKRF